MHWPDGVRIGFDTRDYIVYGAVQQKTPHKCLEALQRKFRPHPRKTVLDPSAAKALETSEPKRKSNWEHTTPEFDDVVERFRKWLYLPNTVGIETMLATVVSQQVEGPPVWMFLVSPPGGAKTETLTSLSEIHSVYLTSSLTPRALISGANWQGDKDPSLIPKLFLNSPYNDQRIKGGQMTKSVLVEKISERIVSLTKKQTEIVVDTVFESIKEALVKGEKIEIRGFGNFKPKVRNPRRARNPKKGERVRCPGETGSAF